MQIRSLILAGLILTFLVGCSTAPKRAEKDKAVSKKPSSTKSVQTPQDATSAITLNSLPPDQSNLPKEATPDFEANPEKALSLDEREQLVNQFLEATLLEENNKYDEAGKAYAKVLEIVPKSSYLGAMTGKALLESGKPDEAIQVAEAAIRNGANPVDAYKVLGLAYRQKKDLNKAIEQYEKLIEIDPDSSDALNELVALYVRTQRYDQAIVIYNKLAQLDSYQSYIYHYRIALIYTQMGKFPEALDEYKLVAKDVPDNFDVHLHIGKLYEVLNQPDDAIVSYLTALQHIRNEQDELNVRNALAPLYFNRKSYQEAIHQYSRIKEMLPEDITSHCQLARIFFTQEKYHDALKELDDLSPKIQGNFFVEIMRLQTQEKLQRDAEGYKKFLEGFDFSIEKRDWENAQRFLAKLTQKDSLKKIEESAHLPFMYQLLDKCVDKFPEQVRPAFAAASIALLRNENDAFQKKIQKLHEDIEKTRTEKNSARLTRIASEIRYWFDVRRAFMSGNLAEALTESLKNSLTEFPENTELGRALACIYMDSTRWSDAEPVLVQAKVHMPNEAPDYKDLLFQLAVVYDKMDRLADVETTIHEIIQKYPDDSQGYNFLGYAYADRNIRLDEAIQLVQKAMKLDPEDGNILDSLGWIYFRMGRLQEATTYLEKAVTFEENDPVILDHLGDARLQQGDQKTALQC
jgi:tetratricopeptide (TPR) repeat protein